MDIEEQSISENSLHKEQKAGYDQHASPNFPNTTPQF